ncbi:MAG: 4-vinyl reductase [Desulfobulbaceae bacterium]|jgi:predicted hydrocarbon binding protein|nr:4-vinyl reductase [Desulfobulbaceae bacterium]
MASRQYEFSWDFIGDIEEGRPNLGNYTRIEVYRLFQYTLRDILEDRYGTEEADHILYDAGFKAGVEFCRQIIKEKPNLGAFVEIVKEKLLEFKIGILRVEQADMDKLTFLLTVAEDLDCSGLPDMGHAVCTYDEGFIAGIFYHQSGKIFEVKEIDCWCTGDRTCRFQVSQKAP